MRAYPYLIGASVIILAYLMITSRINEFNDWEKDHIRETGKTYKESHIG